MDYTRAKAADLIIKYVIAQEVNFRSTIMVWRHSSIQFNWRTQTKICIGVAKGLAYLREQVKPHIIHCDIKASNILLDEDLTPKISDFVLVKVISPNMTHVSTLVAGTMSCLRLIRSYSAWGNRGLSNSSDMGIEDLLVGSILLP
ncbi:putative lrr receptor-like serinethreonine-protein kinase rfk1 [Nicotiana attenuata]|uniref:non-specific serine/threonine protein kinase n=1 Tax=Nicotiana attenuata TaxID=49451 RepID=A0A314L6K5_NICAT|nr:putative lrr receptor-like serinethreonine-protein kinase rfk1 [Nicotiana attenuata]